MEAAPQLQKHIVVLSTPSVLNQINSNKIHFQLGRPLKNVKAVKYIACTEGNSLIRIEELNNPNLTTNNINFLFYTYPTTYPRTDADDFEPLQEKNINLLTVEVLNLNFKPTTLDPATFQLVLALYTEE